VLPKITGYLNQRVHNWERWIGALRRTKVPIHVVWGTEDPVAVVEMAHVLVNEIPNSQVTFLEDIGHFPMLEAPDRWVAAVRREA
jgi:pimeloyl-ACP methyl ester carboxylesterase